MGEPQGWLFEPSFNRSVKVRSVDDRITSDGGLLLLREADHRLGLIEHLARCRAVVFPPWNEDYGFVTVEAFMCGKPVLTCHDSGGPSELVRDGENGFVTAPTPEALATAMNRLGGRSQRDKWVLQAELFNELHRWVRLRRVRCTYRFRTAPNMPLR